MSIESNHYDVVVLGAGAAGFLCAMTAAKRGRSVLLIEKSNKAGKKILMSGGGRCNFTNLDIDASKYLSKNPHFCKAALSRFSAWDFIAMVEKHKIPYEERKLGQLFCVRSARDILKMLIDECENHSVAMHTDITVEEVQSVTSEGCSRFSIKLNQSSKKVVSSVYPVTCESLVVATGALSIPTLGGSGIGYEIAEKFGIRVSPRRAGLVPFIFTDSFKAVCEKLAGTSLAVEVSCNGHCFTESLLFTHRGVSGPVILQISNYWDAGDEISVNLLPNLLAADWLRESKLSKSTSLLSTVLSQKLPKSLVKELASLWWPKAQLLFMAELSDGMLGEIGAKLNRWSLKPSSTEGYRTAEVTLGGVDTDAISSKTMEVREQPGLFFVGEVLDVSGHLGGFNFQWAWASGHAAGLFV